MIPHLFNTIILPFHIDTIQTLVNSDKIALTQY